MKNAVKRARQLRHNSTDAEKVFWYQVRRQQQGRKFYRQVPVKGYIADFLCPELKLIVEIDGGQHNGNSADEIRTQELEKAGYKVIRFWNNDVLGNIEGVVIALKEALDERKIEIEKPWV